MIWGVFLNGCYSNHSSSLCCICLSVPQLSLTFLQWSYCSRLAPVFIPSTMMKFNCFWFQFEQLKMALELKTNLTSHNIPMLSLHIWQQVSNNRIVTPSHSQRSHVARHDWYHIWQMEATWLWRVKRICGPIRFKHMLNYVCTTNIVTCMHAALCFTHWIYCWNFTTLAKKPFLYIAIYGMYGQCFI